MNAGVLAKCVRESWLVLSICAAGVLLAEALFAVVLPTFPIELLQRFFENPFFQRLFRSLLGTDFGGQIDPEMLRSVAWMHPVMLAILWAAAITHYSRMPAMEIERGTIDLMLGMPVARWRVFASEGVVGLGGGVLLVAAALVGCLIGSRSVPPADRPELGRLAIIICNLFCLYVAVAGLTGLLSALSSHRGRAIALAFAIVASSFLVVSLEQVWSGAEHFALLSILNYHRPALIFRDGAWPIGNMAVLLGSGALCWVVGAVVFTRRSVCTV
jgi:ABC-type transport system involved in multi-copper enzyme maturation permease subunit